MSKVKGSRLVPLGRDMHQPKAIDILYIFVSTKLYQGSTHVNVASEGCIMDSCKLIIPGLGVNPGLQLLLSLLFTYLREALVGRENNLIETSLAITKGTDMKESISMIIDHLVNFDTDQHVFQSLSVVSLDQWPALANYFGESSCLLTDYLSASLER
jgi:hypothetical protein